MSTGGRSAPALAVRDVHKAFGRRPALRGVTFSVPRGSVCGLVGPNGAGKTTAMSVVGGFLRPDQGQVDLLGLGPYDPERHRGRVGILPQDAELPPASTPRQLLTTWARLQGLGIGARTAVDEVLRDVLLEDRADVRVSTLSHGMRRRVAVASALLGRPELILLDEPTSGLDPVQARHLREVLVGLRGRHAVLVSSHNLAELESTCDHVVFLAEGRCTREGPMEVVTGRDREVEVLLAPPFPPGRGPTVSLRAPPGVALEDATTELLATLLGEGARIAEVRRGKSLETRYFSDAGAEPS